MRALRIVIAGVVFLTVSAFAVDAQLKKAASNTATIAAVASVGTKRAQKAPKVTPTNTPVRVWSLEMSCCEPQ
ncbi:MAG TPA: hypothetical protein VEL80_02005 [Burkholderiales bacterium]|nr:hypothetical protein [Burkholderiales bacterium]